MLNFGSFSVKKIGECDYIVLAGKKIVAARTIDYKHAVEIAYVADRRSEEAMDELRAARK